MRISAPISRKSLAIFPILCYIGRREYKNAESRTACDFLFIFVLPVTLSFHLLDEAADGVCEAFSEDPKALGGDS